MSLPCTRAVARRTVISAGAWSVPVIALASATPAFASSSCPTGPVAVLRGTFSVTSGALRANQVGLTTWDATGFMSMADNSSPTSNSSPSQPAVVVVSYSFTAVAHASYLVTFGVRGGYSVPNGSSERQSLVVEDVQGGTATTLKKVSLAHASLGGSTLVTDAVMVANGYDLITPAQGQVTFAAPVAAQAAGPVILRFTFTLAARQGTGSSYGNDDLWLTTPTVALTACS